MIGDGLPDGGRNKLLELAVSASPNVVIVTDATLADNPVVYVNPAVERVTGYGVEEVLGRNPRFLQGIYGDQEEVDELRRAVREGREFSGVLRNQKKDGTTFWNEMYVGPVRDEVDGQVTHFIGVQTDVTDRVRAEEEKLRVSSEYERMIRILPNVVFRWHRDEDATPRPSYIEGALAEEFGVTTEKAAGKRIEDLFPADFVSTVSAAYEKAFAGETVEFPSRIGDRFFSNVARPFLREGQAEGAPTDEIVGFGTEVTERVKAEADLRESEEKFRAAFENAPIGVALVDLDDRYMRVNRAFSKMLGYGEEDLVGTKSERITHPEDAEISRAYMRRVVEGGSGYDLEKRYLAADGGVIWVLLNVALVRGSGGEPAYYVCQHQDITRRKALEEELAHRAFHDPLTDLPNRALFTDRLGHALARKERAKGEVAVLFMDLDNFKYVNDSLGHEAGDDLLVEVARRLKGCVRPEDTVARLGGDEFAVLMEGVGGEAGAVEVAERMLGALAPPVEVSRREIFVTPSIGIALAAPGETRPEVVRRDADAAMYGAKGAGKNRFAVFRPDMRGVSSRRLELESDLRRALEDPGREFRVFYQPEALVETGRIVGVEALLRWKHPEQGFLPPADFVGLAEETGLIVPLGRWVLREACRQAKEWRKRFAGDPDAGPTTMSVNLSTRQFQNPGLVNEVAALKASGLEPDGLILEMTESILMEAAPSTVAALRGLRALGVRLAIDDFGTGYSSLSYLKNFPVDFIKIDRSIVGGLHLDRNNLAVVLSTVTLAHALGLRAVAEGVETAEEAEKLREMGCDMGQGFYWWRPGPPEQTAKLLDNRP